MQDEAVLWIGKAEEDLITAKVNADNDRYSASAFFSQQAAEKALKAVYIRKFRELWKIHDLVELARKVGAPAKILEACDTLNPHYIETRYPVEAEYDEDIALKALEKAEEVISWSKKKLGK